MGGDRPPESFPPLAALCASDLSAHDLRVVDDSTRPKLGSPFQPKFHGVSKASFWLRIIEAFWWVLAARSGIGLVRLLIVLEHRPRETQIVSDLIAGVIYVSASLAIIDFALEIGGLLATSGIIAIVLGLALQSTLNGRLLRDRGRHRAAYRAGDLLWVEGGVQGQVLQVNWRLTQISKVNGDGAIVPTASCQGAARQSACPAGIAAV